MNTLLSAHHFLPQPAGQQSVCQLLVVSIKVFQSLCAAAMAAPMSWRRLVYSVYPPAIAGVFTRISDRIFRARDRRGG